MKRIASYTSEVEQRDGRSLDELVGEIGVDVLSWLRGGIHEWDYAEPEDTPLIRTLLRIDGDLHRNGVLLSVSREAEARRLVSMFEVHASQSLRATDRDPSQACALRVSIMSDGIDNFLEVRY